MPYIHDVPGLRRGSLPYDYECGWGRFKYEYELGSYLFTPHNGQVPPGWERYDLVTPIQPMTAVIDRARRLSTVMTPDREIVLRDVPVGDSPYNPSGLSPSGRSLLQQVNAALAQSCQPFVAGAWSGSAVRLTGYGRMASRRSAMSTARLSVTLFVSPVTGYAYDEVGNRPKLRLGVYLGMVRH